MTVYHAVSPSSSQETLFLCQITYARSHRNTLARATNESGASKNAKNVDFSTNKSLYLGNDIR